MEVARRRRLEQDDRQQVPLSSDAQRLLHYLQSWCSSRDRARTDAALARCLDIATRDVIELRRELVQAGHIIISENKDPQGAWLLPPGSGLTAAYAYADRVKERGVAILGGFWKPLVRNIRAEEARQLTESTGQRRLFA